MQCDSCGKPIFEVGSIQKHPVCICQFGGDKLKAAAWFAVQRDVLLSCARDNGQMSLPLDNSPATQFNMAWSSYRDGQRTMLHSVITFLSQTGHNGIAERVRSKFNT